MLTAYSKVNSSLSFAVGRLCLFYPWSFPLKKAWFAFVFWLVLGIRIEGNLIIQQLCNINFNFLLQYYKIQFWNEFMSPYLSQKRRLGFQPSFFPNNLYNEHPMFSPIRYDVIAIWWSFQCINNAKQSFICISHQTSTYSTLILAWAGLLQEECWSCLAGCWTIYCCKLTVYNWAEAQPSQHLKWGGRARQTKLWIFNAAQLLCV